MDARPFTALALLLLVLAGCAASRAGDGDSSGPGDLDAKAGAGAGPDDRADKADGDRDDPSGQGDKGDGHDEPAGPNTLLPVDDPDGVEDPLPEGMQEDPDGSHARPDAEVDGSTEIWVGYLSDRQGCQDGLQPLSVVVVLDLNRSEEIVRGSIMFGAPETSDPDSEDTGSANPCSADWVEGFEYPLRDISEAAGQLQLAFHLPDVHAALCAVQEPIPVDGGYGCIEDGFDANALATQAEELCAYGTCQCSESACSVAPGTKRYLHLLRSPGRMEGVLEQTALGVLGAAGRVVLIPADS